MIDLIEHTCGNQYLMKKVFITPLKNKHKLINLHTAPLDV